MKINRNNYEAYLLDLIEGRLSAEDQQKVRDFLSMNPDCVTDFNEGEPWVLEGEKISFPGREQLKKALPDASFMLTESNFDLFSIARLEGDLTLEQERDHASMVAEKEKMKKEWESWQRTKLDTEPIIFAGKNQLKKGVRRGRRVIWIGIISSAAVITLLFILLRIDSLIPASELAMEAPVLQPAAEEPTRQLLVKKSMDQPEATLVIPNEKRELPTHKPVMFFIKKHPGKPVEAGIQKDSEKRSDTLNQVRQELVRPRPVRIAGSVSAVSEFAGGGFYDRIKPLDIPPATVHLTSLSITQLADVDLQELFDNYTEENTISLWSIANAGIKGINRITGADMSLLAARDNEGDVSGFRFRSKRFSIATPLERSE